MIVDGKVELGYVYFVAAPSVGMVKIGYSRDHPDGRLSGLRGASPVPLEPLAAFHGARTQEKMLHRTFDDLHSHREWFRMAEPLAGYIRAHVPAWPVFGEDRPPSLDPERFHRRVCRWIDELGRHVERSGILS